MDVYQRELGDRTRLGSLLRKERNAEQRDRYLVVLHALLGKQTLWIADWLGRRSVMPLTMGEAGDGGVGGVNLCGPSSQTDLPRLVRACTGFV